MHRVGEGRELTLPGDLAVGHWVSDQPPFQIFVSLSSGLRSRVLPGLMFQPEKQSLTLAVSLVRGWGCVKDRHSVGRFLLPPAEHQCSYSALTLNINLLQSFPNPESGPLSNELPTIYALRNVLLLALMLLASFS